MVELVDEILGHNLEYTRRSVTHSPSFWSSWQSVNPDTGILHACTQCRRAWGVVGPGNDEPEGQDCPIKFSGHFIHLIKKPEKGQFQSSSECPPLQVASYLEHCGIKMGSLNI